MIWADAPNAPRMLHRHSAYGYTRHPAYAMSYEPPALTHDEQEEITRQAKDRELRTWETSRDRILAEIDHLRAQLHGPHVARGARALERQVKALNDKLR